MLPVIGVHTSRVRGDIFFDVGVRLPQFGEYQRAHLAVLLAALPRCSRNVFHRVALKYAINDGLSNWTPVLHFSREIFADLFHGVHVHRLAADEGFIRFHFTGELFREIIVHPFPWLCAVWLIANCKNGVSSCELKRDLGVTQKTARFIHHPRAI